MQHGTRIGNAGGGVPRADGDHTEWRRREGRDGGGEEGGRKQQQRRVVAGGDRAAHADRAEHAREELRLQRAQVSRALHTRTLQAHQSRCPLCSETHDARPIWYDELYSLPF